MKHYLALAATAITGFGIATTGLPLGAAATAPATSTASGVYTEQQAAEGATLYAERCAMCHGKALEGTWEVPPLTGRFFGNWGHAPVSALADYVGRAMPQMAPGSLTADEKLRLVAFLLKSNGMPAGASPLPGDPAVLARITIEPRVASR